MEEKALKRLKWMDLGLGIALVLMGLEGAIDGKMSIRDIPIAYPRLSGGILIALGVAIPIVAWILRSSSREKR